MHHQAPSSLNLDARVEYTGVIGHVRVIECCSQEMLQLDAHADWTGWIGWDWIGCGDWMLDVGCCFIKRKSETETKKSSLFTGSRLISCLSSSEHTQANSMMRHSLVMRRLRVTQWAMDRISVQIISQLSGDSKKHMKLNLSSSNYAATCLTRPLIMLFSAPRAMKRLRFEPVGWHHI